MIVGHHNEFNRHKNMWLGRDQKTENSLHPVGLVECWHPSWGRYLYLNDQIPCGYIYFEYQSLT